MTWTGSAYRWLSMTFFVLTTPTSSWAEGVNWRTDLARARREAVEKRLPLLLDFGNEQCIWCKKLDLTTFRDPVVARLVNESFIAVKVDTHREAQFTQALRVESLPSLLLAAPDGKILARKEGYLEVPAMLQFLRGGLEARPAKVAAKPEPVQRVRHTHCMMAEDEEDVRSARARQLLSRARQDREDKCYLGCLERCRLLLSDYANLPEAELARRLAESLALEMGEMRTRLADVCLEQAAALQRQNDPGRAAACLEQVLLLCPNGVQASEARKRLASVRGRP